MRPGQIRVFDGLRITAEHIEHFQGSLQSSLRDLRELAGAGVHRGLRVEPAEGSAVTVQPGLAFDHQRNRIVCDEPAAVAVEFEPGEEVRYVCARYAPVEDGVVDGRPTLVWDSCELFTRPAPPAPGENEIALARVTRAEDGTLVIEGLGADAPEPAAAAAPVPALRLGIEMLAASADGGEALGAALIDAVRAALPGPGSPGPLAARLDLATREAALPFAPLGVTCHTRLAAVVEADAAPAQAGAEAPPATEPPARQRWTLEGEAHGEAMLGEAGVAQFTFSRGTAATAIAADAVASLPFAAARPADQPLPEPLDQLLAAVTLGVGVQARPGGFALAAMLLWDGVADAALLDAAARLRPSLHWTIELGWRAIGAGPATAE